MTEHVDGPARALVRAKFIASLQQGAYRKEFVALTGERFVASVVVWFDCPVRRVVEFGGDGFVKWVHRVA